MLKNLGDWLYRFFSAHWEGLVTFALVLILGGILVRYVGNAFGKAMRRSRLRGAARVFCFCPKGK